MGALFEILWKKGARLEIQLKENKMVPHIVLDFALWIGMEKKKTELVGKKYKQIIWCISQIVRSLN